MHSYEVKSLPSAEKMMLKEIYDKIRYKDKLSIIDQKLIHSIGNNVEYLNDQQIN